MEANATNPHSDEDTTRDDRKPQKTKYTQKSVSVAKQLITNITARSNPLPSAEGNFQLLVLPGKTTNHKVN